MDLYDFFLEGSKPQKEGWVDFGDDGSYRVGQRGPKRAFF